MAQFKDGFADRLEVPAGADDVQVFDDKLGGFGIRKFRKGGKDRTPIDQPCRSGTASYFVKFNVGNQQRRKTLGRVVKGNLEDMRKEASTILAKAHLGTDVIAVAKAAAAKSSIPTLGALVPLYLKARAGELREKSLEETTRYLAGTTYTKGDKKGQERTPSPFKALYKVPIDAITPKDIVKIIDGMEHKVSADRARVALSGLFAWAIEPCFYVTSNPTNDIKARSQSERTRVLAEPELIEIWNACDDDDFSRIVRLLMLTGQRRAEISDLAWSEIPEGKDHIELPEHRTKNGLPHIIPLSEQSLALLPKRSETRDFVFGRGASGFSGWSKSKRELDDRIAEARRKRKAKPMPGWVLHDLRRSFVTHVAEHGYAQPHVIEAIVNHISGTKAGVAGIYNRATYLTEKREALKLWGAHIARLVSRPAMPGKKAA